MTEPQKECPMDYCDGEGTYPVADGPEDFEMIYCRCPIGKGRKAEDWKRNAESLEVMLRS